MGALAPHYNSMSWASSSEKSDMELSEEESPPPSSCSFRASSVAYRWMYSGKKKKDTQAEWSSHDDPRSLLYMFYSNLPQSINFNQWTNDQLWVSEGYKCFATFDLVFIIFWLVEVQGCCVSVQRIDGVRVGQQLRQERLKDVGEI